MDSTGRLVIFSAETIDPDIKINYKRIFAVGGEFRSRKMSRFFLLPTSVTKFDDISTDTGNILKALAIFDGLLTVLSEQSLLNSI